MFYLCYADDIVPDLISLSESVASFNQVVSI